MLHGGDGGGKAVFSPLEVTVKRQKAPLERTVRTNFVTGCSITFFLFYIVYAS